MAGGIAFVLAPWVSLGFATAVAFIVVAALYGHLSRAHAVVLWASAAFYTTALTVSVAAINTSADPDGGPSVGAFLAVNAAGGGLQALVFTFVAAGMGYRSVMSRPQSADRRGGPCSGERPLPLVGYLDCRVASLVSGADGGTLTAGSHRRVRKGTWDLATGEVTRTFPVGGWWWFGTAVAGLSPDGTGVAVGRRRNTVSVFDTRDGTLRLRIRDAVGGWPARVTAVAFNHDGTRLATASSRGTARIRHTEMPTEQLRADFEHSTRSTS